MTVHTPLVNSCFLGYNVIKMIPMILAEPTSRPAGCRPHTIGEKEVTHVPSVNR